MHSIPHMPPAPCTHACLWSRHKHDTPSKQIEAGTEKDSLTGNHQGHFEPLCTWRCCCSRCCARQSNPILPASSNESEAADGQHVHHAHAPTLAKQAAHRECCSQRGSQRCSQPRTAALPAYLEPRPGEHRLLFQQRRLTCSHAQHAAQVVLSTRCAELLLAGHQLLCGDVQHSLDVLGYGSVVRGLEEGQMGRGA